MNRAVLVALAAVAVSIVVLWPRSEQAAPRAPSESVSAPSAGSADLAESADLAGSAARAWIEPCPQPSSAGSGAGALVGVSARCLGSAEFVDVGAALAGEPTLINLWASWCGPCRAEIPVLQSYAEEPESVRVVGINVRDEPGAALQLLADVGARYPSFGDADAVPAALAAPPVLPLSYLVQRDGTVERIATPAVFEHPSQVREAVGELIR